MNEKMQKAKEWAVKNKALIATVAIAAVGTGALVRSGKKPKESVTEDKPKEETTFGAIEAVYQNDDALGNWMIYKDERTNMDMILEDIAGKRYHKEGEPDSSLF